MGGIHKSVNKIMELWNEKVGDITCNEKNKLVKSEAIQFVQWVLKIKK